MRNFSDPVRFVSQESSCRRWLLFCLVSVSLHGISELALAQEDPDSSVQSLANIRFQNDLRVFSVMAALNAAGFDHETAGEEMSEVRQKVRERLAGLDPDLAQRLEAFYEENRAATSRLDQPQVSYTSLALLLSEPPELVLTLPEEELPSDAAVVSGFAELVQEFYRKANVPELWAEFESEYRDELAAYEPVLKEVIRSTLRYFRMPPRVVLDRQIVLIPDLLDVKEIVNARNLERVYYIVVGPSDSPSRNRRQLEHEYLHFLVDPLVKRFGSPLLRFEDLLDTAQQQPHVRSDYQNRFLLVVTESLVEALQLRMNPPASEEDLNRSIVRLFRRGLIFTPFFLRGLELYEKNEMISLATYLQTVFADFDAEDIEADEEFVASLESAFRAEREREREELLRQQAEAERKEQIRSHFDQASQLFASGKFEEARSEMMSLLEIDPENGNAFFYIGQSFAQSGEHGEALGYYLKAGESASVDDWVRARALLRAGRILASRGEYAKARECFQNVREMPGDLRGAAQEAEEMLRRLSEHQR